MARSWRSSSAWHGGVRPVSGLALIVALVIVLVGGAARPVSADPARPTDFESTILRVSPALPPGLSLDVVGGDSFLELRVPRGHTAVVPDYDQGGREPPPYLRFRADGTVERNERALATHLNESRYGTDAAAPTPGEPRWTVVSRNGRYLWHDHRVHWMVPRRPSTDGSGRVDMGGPNGTWRIDLTIDGHPTVVTGELVLHPSPSPVVWWALIAVSGIGLVAAALLTARRSPQASHRLLAGALLATAMAATVVGIAGWRALPGPAGTGPLGAILPGVAGVASCVALLTSRAGLRRGGLAAAIAALAGWAWLRRAVLARAILPTSLPFPVDRAITALTLGIAAAGAVLLIWSPPSTPVRRAATDSSSATLSDESDSS